MAVVADGLALTFLVDLLVHLATDVVAHVASRASDLVRSLTRLALDLLRAVSSRLALDLLRLSTNLVFHIQVTPGGGNLPSNVRSP